MFLQRVLLSLGGFPVLSGGFRLLPGGLPMFLGGVLVLSLCSSVAFWYFIVVSLRFPTPFPMFLRVFLWCFLVVAWGNLLAAWWLSGAYIYTYTYIYIYIYIFTY